MVVLLIDGGAPDADLHSVETSLQTAARERVRRVPAREVADSLTDDLVPDLTAVVVLCGEDADAGHRVCHIVRGATTAPLAMVSSSRREVDEVMAFANGCDDYICGRSSATVRTARLAALIARGQGGGSRSWTFGCLRLDPLLRAVTAHGEPVSLTPIEFDIAATLLANQRRVVSRRELLEKVWGGTHVPAHVLDVHVSRLRAKVRAVGGPHLAEAVRGVGYRVGRETCRPGECEPWRKGVPTSEAS
jgi:two-component system, OmpR family, response regulator MtrA